MSFYRRIKYFLVHKLKMTNQEAQEKIDSGAVEVEGKPVSVNIILPEHSEIKVDGKIVREATKFIYLKFHKPRGYESTLSPKVENNLSEFFTEFKGLSIAGRLDKDSEGLLLLSTDGKWVEGITNPKFEKEKEYLVELDKTVTSEFASQFTKGVNIGYHITKPCTCVILENNFIKVKLTEGKNRQIRKMCKTLGYNVLSLKRTRIDAIELGSLKPGEKDFFTI